MMGRFLDPRLLVIAVAGVILGVLLDLSGGTTSRKAPVVQAATPGSRVRAPGPAMAKTRLADKAIYRRTTPGPASGRADDRLTVYTSVEPGRVRIVALRDRQQLAGTVRHALELRLSTSNPTPVVEVATVGPEGLAHRRLGCSRLQDRSEPPCVPAVALPLYLRGASLLGRIPTRLRVSGLANRDSKPHKGRSGRLVVDCRVETDRTGGASATTPPTRPITIRLTACRLQGKLTLGAGGALPIVSWYGSMESWVLEGQMTIPTGPNRSKRRSGR